METVVSSDSTISSSPSRAVFSDEIQRTSSPPSSPPGFPWEQIKSSPKVIKPLQHATKTAFSVLGKRKALESISENAQPKKRRPIMPAKRAADSLTQMQISLGQEVQKKCKTCGMEYVQSSAEDRKLHDKYHKQNTEGYDVGKDFVQKARPTSVFKGLKPGDSICALDCLDKPARKKRGQAALEVVQRELGAVEISEKTIWDEDRCSSLTDADYKAYLYVRGTKCIGFLLVQKIREAYRVVEPANLGAQLDAEGSNAANSIGSARDALRARQRDETKRLEELAKRPIELSTDMTPAMLGISRIWTSPTHRHQNIATALLDVAFEAHNSRTDRGTATADKARTHSSASNSKPEGIQENIDASVPAVQKRGSNGAVAFSQPTEAGIRLARRWFGMMFGWKVYVD